MQKLRNPKHEKFAAARAANRTLADSYAEATGKRSTAKNNLACRVSGKRWADRPDIAARIAYLREAARQTQIEEQADIELPDVIDRNVILEILLETTKALEDANDALLKTDLPEVRRRQFYAVLSSHLARQSKLIQSGAEVIERAEPKDKHVKRFNEIFG